MKNIKGAYPADLLEAATTPMRSIPLPLETANKSTDSEHFVDHEFARLSSCYLKIIDELPQLLLRGLLTSRSGRPL